MGGHKEGSPEREIAMDYGRLLSRTWNTVWEHKFLILLGVLVALGGASFNGSSGGSNVQFSPPDGEFTFRLPELAESFDWPNVAVPLTVILLLGFFVAIKLLFWVIGTIARGGLIAGASTIDDGGTMDFGGAFRAGWQKGWRLLGIGVLPAIPGLILAVAGFGLFGLLGLYRFAGEAAVVAPRTGFGIIVAGLACILVPLALALGLLRTFANRACMLEDLGVIASYRRGLNVLLENIGPALILFLIQIAISIGLIIVMFLPGILMLLCCVLWPVLLIVEGTIAAFFSALWTLAWREWTGMTAMAAVGVES
jgi:hypothetical protein